MVSIIMQILFNSPTMRSNLSTISESLDEVVFTVDAGDDTFTVGYYLGDEIYSLEKIMQQIEITVDEINIVCLVAVHGAFLRMNTKPSAVLASHQI